MQMPPPSIGKGPQDEQDYKRNVRRLMVQLKVAERDEQRTVHARIDEGRWVADCTCNAASLVHPYYKSARCAECGDVATVVFPDEWESIEALLIERKSIASRTWKSGESLADVAVGTPGLGLRGARE